MKYNYLEFNKSLKPLARNLRNSMTNAEKKLWYRCLRKLPCQFYRQKPIGHYIADFYCPKLKLVVEVDGWTHSSNQEIARDKAKETEFKKLGLKLLRFNNSQVYDNFNDVCRRIKREAKG